MSKNTVIFIVVGGVGVFLAYQYAKDQGYLAKWFPSMFGATATPPAVTPPASAPPPPAATPPAATPPAPPPPAAPKPPPPPAAPPPAGQTTAQLAAQQLQAMRTALYGQLVAAGVPQQTAADYVANRNADGSINPAYLQTMYQLAASGDAGYMALTDAGGVVLNADQWEYYREAAGLPSVDPGTVFNDRTALIHATEFNQALTLFASTGGMSGLGARRSMNYTPARLAWLM